MGTILRAACSCGYKRDEISFGAGMNDFKVRCTVPALCHECRSVVAIDYFYADQACRQCRSSVVLYPEVRGEKDYEYGSGETWRIDARSVLFLPNLRNRCPRCDCDELAFTVSGYFD